MSKQSQLDQLQHVVTWLQQLKGSIQGDATLPNEEEPEVGRGRLPEWMKMCKNRDLSDAVADTAPSAQEEGEEEPAPESDLYFVDVNRLIDQSMNWPDRKLAFSQIFDADRVFEDKFKGLGRDLTLGDYVLKIWTRSGERFHFAGATDWAQRELRRIKNSPGYRPTRTAAAVPHFVPEGEMSPTTALRARIHRGEANSAVSEQDNVVQM
ncbi:Oidioi.mRNA.OKI2018_I69.chr1.g1350.t1.cds [Oikopleura dioica]|uniref:Oidioi.mRNA.OKI2018_I69.chr1.g1350.t1.cds n=1 Tax=Oikopleura dioica TaxID=34765 RepID=A0ABN7STZ6_OIKDI|nr:Oidioi.mRNA.OKI2018_I69.chr1.g1350.t1.cds [Oikopleura dioica]